MAERKKGEEATAPAKASIVRFRFSKPWSADRGYFAAGSEAELPAEIAEMLAVEDMGEIA